MYTIYVVQNSLSAIQGVRVLAQAVDKIQMYDSQLTAIHADLCQLSLCAKVFKPAVKFLDVDITSIFNTDDGNHDTKYFLLYYYYGGMIYAALKNYDRAMYFFEVAVSTPALAMSHIMLESYRKYILISLILHGTIVPIPKYSSTVITRFMKPLSRPYFDLAAAYATGLSEEVRNAGYRGQEAFLRDRNMGLVKQVVASLIKKNIQRLTKTFLTLSFIDVANKVQLSGADEAEKYILIMIKTGEIHATINQKDGMVVFKDDPEKYNTPEMFSSIQNDIKQIMELNKQIVRMEEEIKLNPGVCE